jgi:2-polyprenyl-6-methoxyphenol hydroxylase-like FAD-dependent oxidoreductase
MEQATAAGGRHGGTAVVIGGSMAGMLAARVLADHFARVVLIERDRFPAGPEGRKGVPQGRHVHALLMRGGAILEDLFPGLQDELGAAGAPRLDTIDDFAWFTTAGWAVRFPSGLETHGCTRDLLDWAVRRRVAAYPRIEFREECDVTGLLPDAAGTGVAGVRLRARGPGAAAEEELRAGLVVDASGRSSRAPAWLQALGYPAVEETVINPFIGYATRCYAPPPGFQARWKVLLVGSALPEMRRGGGIVPIEGGCWLVTLSGAGRDYPPTDERGFLEFARSLRTPALYEAIKDAQPLGPIAGYRATENRWRRYERLARRPERFVVLGDAACCFNPVYGQGMSAAALAAMTLDGCLRAARPGDLRGVSRRFQRRLARTNARLWLLATGEDFRCRETEGGRPGPLTRLAHRYMDRVILRATHDGAVRMRLLEVLHLLRPAQALVAPRIAWAVLRPRAGHAPALAPLTMEQPG